MPQPVDTRESIDIENSGQTVVKDIGGRATLGVHIRADAAAEYAIDVRDTEGGTWMQGWVSLTGGTDYDDVRDCGAAEVRVRCTTGTAGAGDAADVLITASD